MNTTTITFGLPALGVIAAFGASRGTDVDLYFNDPDDVRVLGKRKPGCTKLI